MIFASDPQRILPMISTLLHLVRLFPFLCGGHRQLVLENLALRQHLAVYRRMVTRPKLRPTDRLFFSEAACQEQSSLVVSAPSLSSSFGRTTKRAYGRARCARFVILLFALSAANDDSPAHDGVMRSGGGAIWLTALNISQEEARAHRPFASSHSGATESVCALVPARRPLGPSAVPAL